MMIHILASALPAAFPWIVAHAQLVPFALSLREPTDSLAFVGREDALFVA